MDKVQPLIDQLKKQLKQKRSSGIILLSLDNSSKNKYDLLKRYLPEIQKALQSIFEELNETATQVDILEKQFNENYKQKNFYIKEKENLDKQYENMERSIVEFERKVTGFDNNIKMLDDKIKNLEQQIQSKKDKRDALYPQCFIPFYGIKVATDINKLEKETIPHLIHEVNQYINQINHCQMQKDQYIHEQRPDYNSFSILKMKIENIKKQINVYDQVINNIHQQISSAIKDIAYLTILQNRVEDTLANSQNISKVMQMLDKNPQTIHYDKNDIYFDMLEKWNQSHDMNVFQNYIMQSEKEFFSV